MNRAYFNAASSLLRNASKQLLQNMDRTDRVKVIINSKTQVYENMLELSIENEIINRLHDLYPTHRILSEHRGLTPSIEDPEDKRFTWVVDPVDGITNFMNMVPSYCMSLSLYEDKECIMSVIYQPVTDDVFSAIKDQGALFNGKKMRAQKVAPDKTPLIAISGQFEMQTAIIDMDKRLDRDLTIDQFRLFGSSGLALAYHALGAFDILYARNIPIYGFSAGLLLAQESGCVIKYEQESDLMVKRVFSHLKKSR